ncbi:hypothetical protein Bpfe_024816 [Biomphalaria pfeifferi]|uniref:Uncharacterized protein n=1 Tax=Biomphalaria pfeifferi TaxID=112525 RepID=A0AAD8F025_BIOPF|nr:hypothetical protein Bpfe_024816 [Biomphalaria pfeifferi]
MSTTFHKQEGKVADISVMSSCSDESDDDNCDKKMITMMTRLRHQHPTTEWFFFPAGYLLAYCDRESHTAIT